MMSIFVAGCGDEGNNDDDDGVLIPDTANPDNTDNPDATTPDDANDPDAANPDGTDDPDDGDDPVQGAPAVSFANDIQPILNARCAVPGCHVGAGQNGLNLETYDNFKKGGNSGPAFIAGDGKNSLVVQRIDGGGMPLGGRPLDEDEIQLFIDWIDAGAENN
jgi:hypothetical protein